MSLLVINPNTLTDIADAIREKTGGVDLMTPLEMPDEIASITGSANEFYLINPNTLDFLNASGLTNNYAFGEYAQKIQSGSGINPVSMGNHNSQRVVYFNYLGNHILGFCTAISSEYKTIEIDIDITSNVTGQYNFSQVGVSTNPIPASIQVPGGDLLRRGYMTSYSMSSAQINAQEHFTINSTSPYTLARQIVKLDISDIVQDCYFYMHNCDCNLYIRSVKVTK